MTTATATDYRAGTRGGTATNVACLCYRSMSTKERLSATVDAELVAAAQNAVAAGRAESVSSWVNDALRMKADQDMRLAALDDFLAVYESEHGEITEEAMEAAVRRARKRAVVVRGRPAGPDAPSSGGRGPSSC